MIDIKAPLRKAYYELLNGSLLYNGIVVPVSTQLKKLEDAKANPYVLISGQSGSNADTFQTFNTEELISLNIVYDSARGDSTVVDAIAAQILNRVLPAPGKNGLIRQTGVYFNCVYLFDDRNLDVTLSTTSTRSRRVLTFKQRVDQTNKDTIMPGLKRVVPVMGGQFLNDTEYKDPNGGLNGQAYEIFFNDIPHMLKYEQDWRYAEPGEDFDFKILIENFSAILAPDSQFYVFLK